MASPLDISLSYGLLGFPSSHYGVNRNGTSRWHCFELKHKISWFHVVLLLYLVQFGQCSFGQAEELFHICRMVKLPTTNVRHNIYGRCIQLMYYWLTMCFNQACKQREKKEFLSHCKLYSNLFFLSFRSHKILTHFGHPILYI